MISMGSISPSYFGKRQAERSLVPARRIRWTRDDRLRHPVFIGLREDKSATDVLKPAV
jgi:ATP-dependent DNA ligase